MQEPIEIRLKDPRQVALARLQDVLVEAIIETEPNIIFHGGTAIWRCYNGNRFSDDIGIYATDKQIKKLNMNLTWALSKRGARMEYPVYTDRAITVTGENAKSRLEAMKTPKGVKPVQAEYVRADGSKLFVNTLSIQGFIAEKAATYVKRRYVRDIYDLYHLVAAERLGSKAKAMLKRFVSEMDKPIDEGKLKDLVYTGVAPSFETMIIKIREAID